MVYVIAETSYSYVESTLYMYKIPVCFMATNIIQWSKVCLKLLCTTVVLALC